MPWASASRLAAPAPSTPWKAPWHQQAHRLPRALWHLESQRLILPTVGLFLFLPETALPAMAFHQVKRAFILQTLFSGAILAKPSYQVPLVHEQYHVVVRMLEGKPEAYELT